MNSLNVTCCPISNPNLNEHSTRPLSAELCPECPLKWVGIPANVRGCLDEAICQE